MPTVGAWWVDVKLSTTRGDAALSGLAMPASSRMGWVVLCHSRPPHGAPASSRGSRQQDAYAYGWFGRGPSCTLFLGVVLQCLELQLNQPEPSFSSAARLALALPVRWLCRRGIADGGGWVRRGKELLLEALDSGVALLQQLQALLAFEQLLLAFEQLLLAFERFDPQPLCFLLDVVDGSPVAQLLRRRLRLRQQAPPRRQGGDPFRPGHGPGGCRTRRGCHRRSS